MTCPVGERGEGPWNGGGGGRRERESAAGGGGGGGGGGWGGETWYRRRNYFRLDTHTGASMHRLFVPYSIYPAYILLPVGVETVERGTTIHNTFV